jgi:hypothetical protein
MFYIRYLPKNSFSVRKNVNAKYSDGASSGMDCDSIKGIVKLKLQHDEVNGDENKT